MVAEDDFDLLTQDIDCVDVNDDNLIDNNLVDDDNLISNDVIDFMSKVKDEDYKSPTINNIEKNHFLDPTLLQASVNQTTNDEGSFSQGINEE